MKFKSILSLAALSAMMVGCSDDPAQNTGNNETGESYLSIAINLPTTAANDSRAAGENDDFDDGLASEYAVKSAHLVIFQGATEADAKVKNVYPMTALKPWNTSGTSTDNITTVAQTVQQINDAPADNLWVMVVLNDPAAATHFAKDVTFASLTTTAQNVELNGTDGFFMVNAPLYRDNKAQTLVKITSDNIKSTKEAALAAAPVEVYVERAVGKVELQDKSTTGDNNKVSNIPTINNDEASATATEYVAKITGWDLDITNTKSYLVRNVSDFNSWKDLESKITGHTAGARFYAASQRIYWAKDPNYDTYVADDFNNIAKDGSTVTKTTDDVVYCRENTFDVDNMNRNQTTRVIIKATFTPTTTGAVTETFYTLGTLNTIYNAEGMRKLVISHAIKLFPAKNDASKYSIQGSSVSQTRGDHTLSLGDVKYDGTALDQTEINQLNAALGTIHTYLDGECFYVARVKHFGDTYTPWVPGSAAYGTTDVDANYLGRYGIVRNNWYVLEVSKITKLGNPDVPTAPSTPDDENEYYINVKCNVHSWAKRVQDVVL